MGMFGSVGRLGSVVRTVCQVRDWPNRAPVDFEGERDTTVLVRAWDRDLVWVAVRVESLRITMAEFRSVVVGVIAHMEDLPLPQMNPNGCMATHRSFHSLEAPAAAVGLVGAAVEGAGPS